MAGEANGQTGGGKNNKTVVILLGVVIVLLIAVLGVFAALLLKKNDTAEAPAQETKEKRSVVVSEENAADVVDEMMNEEVVDPGYYQVTMSTTWHFNSGDAVSEDAYVANDISNSNDVYFDLFIEGDEDNPILQSPIIPRGGEMTDIKLDTPIDAGTYDCIMVYHLVDEDQNTLSTLRFGFKIVVEN